MRRNPATSKGATDEHQAYLLHLWHEPRDQVWRATLRTPSAEQEITFANLDELFVYLLRQTVTPARENRGDEQM